MRLQAATTYITLVLALLGGGAAACGDPFMPRAGVATLDDSGGDGFVAVSAGREHTCALTEDGTAYCWGSNEYGQLGSEADDTRCMRDDRPVPCRRAPVPVSGGLKFLKLRAGANHTCAIALDHAVYCWGDNRNGALGEPTVGESPVPLRVASSALFEDVAAGASHSCGVRTDGVAMCWGMNDRGQLGVASAGNGHASPVAAQTLARFASISAGDRRTCARTAAGLTYCWGAQWAERHGDTELYATQQQPLRVINQPADFQSVVVGGNVTCAISTDTRAYCWEANSWGGFGDGTRSGSKEPIEVQAVGGLGFVAITVGRMQTCAIADNGAAFCWGGGRSGQLGVPTATLESRCGSESMPCSRIPLRVTGRRVFSQISAGLGDHTCGITLGKNVYCWGAGAMGQRGDGRSTSGEAIPVKTLSPSS